MIQDKTTFGFLMMILLCLFLSYDVHADDTHTNYRKEQHLFAIGIVVEKITKQPVDSVIVELTDLMTGDKMQAITKKDGNFYFELKPETQYSISIINSLGLSVDTKLISTINVWETKLFHILLEYSKPKYKGLVTNLLPAYEEEEEKKDLQNYAKASWIKIPDEGGLLLNLDSSEFVFKINIGTFTKPLLQNSKFLAKVKEEVEVELTPTGLTQYVVGRYIKYPQAEERQKYLIDEGYVHASIVAYVDSQYLDMPIEQVLKLQKRKASISNFSEEKEMAK